MDDFDRAKSIFIYRHCGPFLAKISRAIVKAYDDVAGGKIAPAAKKTSKTKNPHAAAFVGRFCGH